MTEEEKKDKLKSRKFIVWITWLVITVCVIISCLAVIFLTKDLSQNMSSLLEKILTFFFSVSMMYLGVNAGQKIGFALSDAISTKKEEGTKDEITA
jgi:uncharacterized protein YacL